MKLRINALSLALFGAAFSQVPLEAFGISGAILQRIPIGPDNGIPYLDLLVLPIVIWYLAKIVRSTQIAVVDVFCLGTLLMALIYLPLARGISPNQLFGLMLALLTCTACGLVSRASMNSMTISWIDGYLRLQTIFTVTLSVLLILHSIGILSYANSLLTQIDRFEGEGLRSRWASLRLVEHMAICTSTSWAIYRAIRKENPLFALIPIVFAFEMLILSSRGGLVLILTATLIPVFALPLSNQSRNLMGVILGRLLVPLSLTVILFTVLFSERGQSLIRNISEISDDQSIRSRMATAALNLYFQHPYFGIGYADLFSTPEWQPFILPNMLLPLHNMYLHNLLYFGPIGLALFGGLNVYVAIKLVKVFRARKHWMYGDDIRMVAGISASAFLGGQYMLALQTLDRISYLYYWTFAGLILTITTKHRNFIIRKAMK